MNNKQLNKIFKSHSIFISPSLSLLTEEQETNISHLQSVKTGSQLYVGGTFPPLGRITVITSERCLQNNAGQAYMRISSTTVLPLLRKTPLSSTFTLSLLSGVMADLLRSSSLGSSLEKLMFHSC